jgi:hypothetical protein
MPAATGYSGWSGVLSSLSFRVVSGGSRFACPTPRTVTPVTNGSSGVLGRNHEHKDFPCVPDQTMQLFQAIIHEAPGRARRAAQSSA